VLVWAGADESRIRASSGRSLTSTLPMPERRPGVPAGPSCAGCRTPTVGCSGSVQGLFDQLSAFVVRASTAFAPTLRPVAAFWVERLTGVVEGEDGGARRAGGCWGDPWWNWGRPAYTMSVGGQLIGFSYRARFLRDSKTSGLRQVFTIHARSA